MGYTKEKLKRKENQDIQIEGQSEYILCFLHYSFVYIYQYMLAVRLCTVNCYHSICMSIC